MHASKTTRPWMGRWLMGVALLHTLFGLVVFSAPLARMWQRGLFDTVGADPLLGAVSWFLLFGAPLALLGLALSALERLCATTAPWRALGLGLLGLTALGLLLMPASGFWLALPVAFALLRRAR
ncbi:DUF6463 family protein [Pelomonas sp. CA6]|uniref:DUF6463 family protein n=1 Tax=Pelomonas sp. CA6 TaxID=2907999 RepID=UPI001F4BD783|nr:DUF6463 family protein [Pelomonas sp. CA6]MCH7345455.1 DUF6463 family protein [Pelomonas sp. CA6]